jgi:hypothetical protein
MVAAEDDTPKAKSRRVFTRACHHLRDASIV